jgi:hypothetical protein
LAQALKEEKYRPEAVREVHHLLNTGRTEVVDADLADYFGSIRRIHG